MNFEALDFAKYSDVLVLLAFLHITATIFNVRQLFKSISVSLTQLEVMLSGQQSIDMSNLACRNLPQGLMGMGLGIDILSCFHTSTKDQPESYAFMQSMSLRSEADQGAERSQSISRPPARHSRQDERQQPEPLADLPSKLSRKVEEAAKRSKDLEASLLKDLQEVGLL